MKSADALAALYEPRTPPTPAVAWMIGELRRRIDSVHWARLQEIGIAFRDARGRALLLHELVLYAEERAQADPGLAPCVRYEFWERRAYAAQHAYLGADGLGQVTLASPERWLTGCGRPPTAGPTEVASR
jgi:hypothetical protein